MTQAGRQTGMGSSEQTAS